MCGGWWRRGEGWKKTRPYTSYIICHFHCLSLAFGKMLVKVWYGRIPCEARPSKNLALNSDPIFFWWGGEGKKKEKRKFAKTGLECVCACECAYVRFMYIHFIRR